VFGLVHMVRRKLRRQLDPRIPGDH
jgi:hypothetical protein